MEWLALLFLLPLLAGAGEDAPIQTPYTPPAGPLPGQWFFPGFGWRWIQTAPRGRYPSHYCTAPGVFLPVPPPKPPPTEPRVITGLIESALQPPSSGIDPTLPQSISITSLMQAPPARTQRQPGVLYVSDYPYIGAIPPEFKMSAVQEIFYKIQKYQIRRIHVDLCRIINSKIGGTTWYQVRPNIQSGPVNIQKEMWISQLSLVFQKALEAGWKPKKIGGPRDEPPNYAGVHMLQNLALSLAKGGPVGFITTWIQNFIGSVLNAIKAGEREKQEARQNLTVINAIPKPPSYGVLRWIWFAYCDMVRQIHPRIGTRLVKLSGDYYQSSQRPTLWDFLRYIRDNIQPYKDYPSKQLPLFPPQYIAAFNQMIEDPYKEEKQTDLDMWFLIFGDYILQSQSSIETVDNLMFDIEQLWTTSKVWNQWWLFGPKPITEMFETVNWIIDKIQYEKNPYLIKWYISQRQT